MTIAFAQTPTHWWRQLRCHHCPLQCRGPLRHLHQPPERPGVTMQGPRSPTSHFLRAMTLASARDGWMMQATSLSPSCRPRGNSESVRSAPQRRQRRASRARGRGPPRRSLPLQSSQRIGIPKRRRRRRSREMPTNLAGLRTSLHSSPTPASVAENSKLAWSLAHQ